MSKFLLYGTDDTIDMRNSQLMVRVFPERSNDNDKIHFFDTNGFSFTRLIIYLLACIDEKNDLL